MWLLHKEQTDGSNIQHPRNGREFRLPELPHLNVDGYCTETKTVYEFVGCFWHAHTCLPFRDVPTMGGDTLCEKYEKIMDRLEQITRAGYVVEAIWECDFDDGIMTTHSELQVQPMKNTVL
jgi:G:T-mismatch repair DNA endonuclease (very short patch repair protein)